MWPSENKSLVMGHWHQPEQPSCLDRSPLAASAVGQGHHDRLQVIADDFKFANTLELHRLPRQVLLRCHCVGKYVEEHGTAAGCVDPEGHHIVHNRLEQQFVKF